MVNLRAERVAAASVRSGGWVRRARSTVQRCCGRDTPPRSLLAAWSLTGGHLLAAEDAKSRSRASQRTLRHGTQPAVPHERERRCVRLVRSSDLRPEWLCYQARGPCWRCFWPQLQPAGTNCAPRRRLLDPHDAPDEYCAHEIPRARHRDNLFVCTCSPSNLHILAAW